VRLRIEVDSVASAAESRVRDFAQIVGVVMRVLGRFGYVQRVVGGVVVVMEM
jgi:hypothetical protein